MKLVLFCRHSDLVHYLTAEIDWLKIQMTHERQRAEVAIDELLRLKASAGPVTQPLVREDKEDRLIAAAEAMLKNPEFVEAGEAS